VENILSETFYITINQLLVLFALMVCGYILKKKNVISDTTSNVLSQLEFYIFLPALSIKTFATNFHYDIIREKLYFVFVAIAILTVTYILAMCLSKLFSKDKLQQDVYTYSFTMPNFGYLGYPLVGAVFGEVALFNMMIFTIPYNLFAYTFGMHLLNPKKNWSVKKLLNPIMIALVIGIILGLSNITLPKFIADTTTMASNCMAPVAMILTGFVLAKKPVKDMVCNPKMYIASFIRLILIPVAIGTLLYFIGIRGSLLIVAVATLAMPAGLNSVVFPEAFGGDGETGAQLCFVSNSLGLLIIPIIFGILASI